MNPFPLGFELSAAYQSRPLASLALCAMYDETEQNYRSKNIGPSPLESFPVSLRKRSSISLGVGNAF